MADRWQGPSKLRRAASAVIRRESRELCRLTASGFSNGADAEQAYQQVIEAEQDALLDPLS